METPGGGCGLLALLLAFVVLFLGVQSKSVLMEVSGPVPAPTIEAVASPR